MPVLVRPPRPVPTDVPPAGAVRRVTRRQFLQAALGGGALLGAGLVGWTWQVEPFWVELVRRPLPLPGLPDALVGRTLLHLSDLHVGPKVPSDYLVRALRDAAALEPDLVVVTGDFVTWRGPGELRELATVLRALPRGRQGTFASLGNHDYGHGWRELDVAAAVTRVVEDAGATVLRNAVVDHHGLQVAGLGDLWSPEFDALGIARAALDPARPALVLSHNPDACDLPGWERTRGWILGGHTHGGQCRPPFLPPPVLPVRNRRYTAGAFDVGPGRSLYVSRGLGFTLQVRVNVRPEMTLFELRRA